METSSASGTDVRIDAADPGLASARLARVLRTAAPRLLHGRLAIYHGGPSAPRLLAGAGALAGPVARAAAAAAIERGLAVREAAIAEDGRALAILALPIERTHAALVLCETALGPREERAAHALARLLRAALA